MSNTATDLTFEAPAPVARRIADDVEIIECEQGGSHWHDARAGAITASMFGEVRRVIDGLTAQQQRYVDSILSGMGEKDARALAGYKAAPKTDKIKRALDGERVGDYTAAAKDYAFRLAVERIAGMPLQDERFETYAMRRGHELEPDARALHAINTGYRIQRAGIVRTRDGKFGASADALINLADNPGKIEADGGGEYKCFTAPEKLRAILIDNDIGTDAMNQIQGCLWLTGRHWWHFGLYCEHLLTIERELTLIEVPRDDDYIERLEADLIAFDQYVEQCRERIENHSGRIVMPIGKAA